MIKIENAYTVGWEAAIRGMRNPMNSWDKSDSFFVDLDGNGYDIRGNLFNVPPEFEGAVDVGKQDHELMMRLCKAGSSDAKFRRFIICYADITGPLYWLKEMDTYRMGVEKNSCSTMHKITSKEFTPDDFSIEHLYDQEARTAFGGIINTLNLIRDRYFELKKAIGEAGFNPRNPRTPKSLWYHLIQLLPSSYNQRRTYMFSYEALSKIYRERRNHKLDEWHQFCSWIESLPYSEIITLKEAKSDE